LISRGSLNNQKRAPAPTPPSHRADHIRADFDAITFKAMHHDRLMRYRTASAFADDVERYLRHEPVSAHPDNQLYRLRQFIRRNRLVVGAALAVAVSLVTGTAVATWQAIEARAQQAHASVESDKAKASRDFMLSMFDSGLDDSVGALQKRQQPVGEMLAEASKKLNTQFDSQPHVKSEMLRMLGSLHHQLDLLPSARELRQRHVESLIKQRAPAAEIGMARVDYASSLLGLAETQLADKELREVAEQLKSTTDAASQLTYAAAVANIANMRALAGDTKGMTEQAEQAVELFARYAPKQKDHIQALTLAAYGRLAIGEHARAINELKQALAYCRETYPSAGYLEASVRTQLSEAYSVTRDLRLAIEHADASVAIADASAGEGSYVSGHTAYWAGKLHVQAGNPKQGITLLRKALANFERFGGAVSPEQLIVVRAFLVEALVATGELSEASTVG